MSGPVEVLVACSRPEDLEALTRILVRRGLTPIHASSVETSCGILADRRVRLVFCDDELPDGSVGQVLEEVQHTSTRVPVIVISRLENWDEYLRAMRLGAFDYISSPLRRAEAEQVIRRALDELPSPSVPPGSEPDGSAGQHSPEDAGRESRENGKTGEDGGPRPKHRLRSAGREERAGRKAVLQGRGPAPRRKA